MHTRTSWEISQKGRQAVCQTGKSLEQKNRECVLYLKAINMGVTHEVM